MFNAHEKMLNIANYQRNVIQNNEIKTVSPKENQCLGFIGRTDANAEAPIL